VVRERYTTTTTKYILNQAEHHRKISYQEEIREIFKRHRVAFDERYVWDCPPRGSGRPFRAGRFISLHPGLKHLGYSVRPLCGRKKTSKLQRWHKRPIQKECV